jgi:ribosomal protein S6
MKLYEIAFLIDPKISEKEAEEVQQKIENMIQDIGGIFWFREKIVKKNLAYPIKKQFEAYLASVQFFLKPQKIKEVEKKLKKESQILRYLIVTRQMKKGEVQKATGAERKEEKVELEKLEKKLEEILEKENYESK